jgi:UDP:flavonoid glycosyltransferase YjiC (YdhE family)
MTSASAPARRFLLTLHDAGGTVPPMIAITQALRRAGHDVVVLAQPSVRSRAVAAGATFVPFTALGDYDRRVPLEEQIDLIVPALTGMRVAEDLLAVAREHDVDATLTDANLAGALAAAESLDRPSAVMLHSLYRTFVDVWMGEVWPLLGDLVNATRAELALAPAGRWPDLFRAHDRLIPVVPAAFDAPTEVPPAPLDHYGFLVPAPARADRAHFPDGDGPKVLVGLSTTYLAQEALLQSIVDALEATGASGIVTTGAAVDPGGLRAPEHVRVTPWCDPSVALEAADVMVTHAGMASVAGALQAGVPLVCTPISRDQPLNAARVEQLGAGVTVPPDADAADIARAIRRVVIDPAFGTAARGLEATSAAGGGATAAAAALVALAG